MQFFKRLSIKRKLTIIIQLVTVITVAVGFTLLTINNIRNYKSELISSGIITSRIVGEYIIIPLTFGDSERAQSTLSKLASVPEIEHAVIYDEFGNFFVRYDRKKIQYQPDSIKLQSSSYFSGGYLHLFEPIKFQTVRYGTIYLQISTEKLDSRIQKHVTTMIIMLIGLMVLSFLLAYWLQKFISQPILDLAMITKKISNEEDYSIPLRSDSNDEIGILYRGFNTMMEQIVKRQHENMQAQLALKNAHEQLRGIIDAIPQMIYIKNREGIFRLANRKIAEHYNLRTDDLIGKSIKNHNIPSIDKLNSTKINAAVFDENREIFIPELETRDIHGNQMYIQISKLPFIYNGEKTILAAAMDITHKKIVEKELRESQEQFSIFMDMLPAATFIKDKNSNYLYVNQYLKNNFDAENWIGNMIVVSTDKSVASHLYEDQQALLGPVSLDEKLYDKHGNARHYETWKFPIKREGRSPLIGGIAIEITKRKRAEQSIQFYVKELERNNAELAEFNYVASHDLREPLRTLTSYCELLREDVGIDNMSEDVREDISFIIDAAHRMNVLIQDLLQLSRAGRIELHKEKIDLNQCMKVISKDLQTKIKETQTQLSWNLNCYVLGDITQITRVLQNLVHNAIKFQSNEIPKVNVACWPIENNMVEIVVSDNGIGIENNYLEQIFSPFKRLHAMGKYDGTGIGLSICKKIVERHGGRIYAKSQSGNGSQFVFTLKNFIKAD